MPPSGNPVCLSPKYWSWAIKRRKTSKYKADEEKKDDKFQRKRKRGR
jgi:hypothetical protein